MPELPWLRDELLAMVDAELAAASRFFEVVDADDVLGAEMERRLNEPATALTTALEGWETAPLEAGTLLEVNAANGERLAEIVAGGTWPGLRTVGIDGTDATWMLAQHADRLGQIRRAWLPLLAQAVASGDADPRQLATLSDRVAVTAGEPQEFGTIALVASDGEIEHPHPVRDPLRLDERRRAIGLAPMAAEAPYLADGDLVPYGPDRGSVPVNQWPMVLEGHVSVESALEGRVRHVHRIWASRAGDRRLRHLRTLARERSVLIDNVEPQVIDEVASGRTHGGVVALVGPRRVRSVGDLVAEVGERSLIVMLDGIEDPFNQGQAVRALYAAGVDGLVGRRSWEIAVTTVTRASAGTTELLPTATAESVEDAAMACRRSGMRVAVTVPDPDADELTEADLRGGLFVLIGGERRGVTRSFVDQADLRLRIGYGRPGAPELGAATSAALVGFEALRQRRGRAG